MGKISVKHYLNKKVKPNFENDGVTPEYPIYYYITVNRKTIHKPSNIIDIYSEDMFSKGCDIMGVGNLHDLIRRESNMIAKICEIFISDYDNKCVKTEYQTLFSRGFTSKDEFINGLNSYISYYSQSIYSICIEYTRDKINRYLTQKIENCFDTSMLETSNTFGTPPINRYRGLGVSVSTENMSSSKRLEFLTKNLDDQHLTLYHIERWLHECLAQTNMKYGYDLPLIEWINGDLQNDVYSIISKKTKSPLQRPTKDHYTNTIIPIIDNICSLESQISLRAGWLSLTK